MYLDSRPILTVCACLAAGIAFTQQLDDNWSLAVGDDPSTFEDVTSLQQESADTIKDEYATRDVHPLLAFRCTPGDDAISMQIDWRRFISSFNTEVGFSVDSGKMIWQKWGVDRSNRITSSKSASDVQSLTELLHDGEMLQVEVAPYSEPPVTVQFVVAGFSQALGALKAECQ